MAKIAIPPEQERDADRVIGAQIYWPKCEYGQQGEGIQYTPYTFFPFSWPYELGLSFKAAQAYREETGYDIMVDDFIKKMCASEYAAVIEKNLTPRRFASLMHNIGLNLDKRDACLKTLYILTDAQSIGALDVDQYTQGGALTIRKRSSLFARENECASGKQYRCFHDRVVLLDNNIWHFGAGICGMHDSPHAYSGPWPDEGNRLRNFIDNLES